MADAEHSRSRRTFCEDDVGTYVGNLDGDSLALVGVGDNHDEPSLNVGNTVPPVRQYLQSLFCSGWGWDYEEKVCSVDPFEAQITIPVEGDAIALTVDDDLEVVEVTEIQAADSA